MIIYLKTTKNNARKHTQSSFTTKGVSKPQQQQQQQQHKLEKKII